MKKLTKGQRSLLLRILASAALLVFSVIFAPESGILGALFFAVPYLLSGYDVIIKAAKNTIGGRQIFDENFLMVVASIGAFAVGEFSEAVAVMTFYQAGELFQSLAVERSRISISSLMDIKPDYAVLLSPDGSERRVSPEEVQVGDTIIVRSGERVPLDGVVLEGFSSLDTSSLTGESRPQEAAAGDEVFSGSISVGGVLTVKVTKEYGESTVQKILELAEDAAFFKAKTERFITRFSRYYTPIVVGLAVALAAIPPIFLGDFALWFHRALIFLVVSCPCALVISVPLTFFAGLGGASKTGVLVRGADSLEKLASVTTAVFDKTGTLTEGRFRVADCRIDAYISKEQLLSYAAAAEAHSSHPLAEAIKAASAGAPQPEEFSEHPGGGVAATVEGCKVLCGSRRFLSQNGIDAPEVSGEYAAVYVALEGVYLGCILLEDSIKPGASEAAARLRTLGVKELIMLSGDRPDVVYKVAEKVGLDGAFPKLLPQDKADKLRELLDKKQGGSLIFAGDGVNDAPALAMADVGIAMGALGSDAAVEAADVVIMDDDPRRIASVIAVAKKTMAIAYQNIAVSIGIKVLVMVLGALGIAGMWSAVFADVGVMVIAALNAIRALYPPKSALK